MIIYAQVNNHGTAMSETAVCVHHLGSHGAHLRVTRDYTDNATPMGADLVDPSWKDCTGNETLSCNVCGANDQTPDLVNKTIESIEVTTVDSEFNEEPATVLHFTDGTSHTFVHPQEAHA